MPLTFLLRIRVLGSPDPVCEDAVGGGLEIKTTLCTVVGVVVTIGVVLDTVTFF